MNNKFDCLARDVIHSTIADFFREDEILAAKQILSQHIDTCQPATIQPLLKKCIGENKIDRTINDLLSIFCVTVENGARGILPVFCAASLSRIPTVPDDMSDLAAVKAELAAVKQQVSMTSAGSFTLLRTVDWCSHPR